MMNDKKLERAAKVITALLFVVSVIMFAVCVLMQLRIPEENIEVTTAQNAPVSPVEAVESKIDISEDTDEVFELVPLTLVVKSPEVAEEVIEEEPIEVVEVDPEEVELLAKVIYQEAGSDACCDECRRMVADVVLNRVADDRFPDTMLEVLTQERQYGRYYWTGVIWPERVSYESEAAAVDRAYRIAEEVLSGEKHSDLYGQGYIWQAEFRQGTDIVSCGCGGSWIYFGR